MAERDGTGACVPCGGAGAVEASAILRFTSALDHGGRFPLAGPAPGERARAGEQARVRLRDVAVPLGVLLALGLVLRLIIAYVLLPGSGFKVDVASFNGWARRARQERAATGSTTARSSSTTRPAISTSCGRLASWPQLLGGPGAAPGDLLKLPAMLADLGLAVAVFQLAADLGARRRAGACGGRAVPVRARHVVRQRRLVPGRLGRHARPAARRPRPVARSRRARDPAHDGGRHHQAPVRDFDPAGGGPDHPAQPRHTAARPRPTPHPRPRPWSGWSRRRCCACRSG